MIDLGAYGVYEVVECGPIAGAIFASVAGSLLSKMLGGMFGGDKSEPQAAPPPAPPPTPVMPTPTDEQVGEARKRALQLQSRRQGRASTILTDPVDETLG